MATTIKYNDEIIATIDGEQTAALNCAGKKATTDIVVDFDSCGLVICNDVETAVSTGKRVTLTCAGKKMPTNVSIAITATNAGLYDANDNLVASWDTLVNTYGMDVEKDYTSGNYSTATTSPMYIVKNHSELTTTGGKWVIPEGIRRIGDYAFCNFTSYTEFTIPSSVISIGNYSFHNCDSVAKVHIADIAAWCRIAFSGASSNPLAEGDSETGLYLNGTLLTDLIIPDSITTIGKYAFHNCDSLQSITIPDSVTTIDKEAFRNCGGLSSVTIPDSVTTIGGSAFSYCTSLTSVTIGDSVTTIGTYAFSGCSSLSDVTFGSSVKEINIYAFNGCGLVNISLPDSLEYIDDTAFADCDSLLYTYYDGGKYLGNANNPYVALIGKGSGSTCTMHKDTKTMCPRAFRETNIESITIQGVSTIPYGVFIGCTSLTSVTFADSVVKIGTNAFWKCTGLTSISIPRSVKTIQTGAFGDCTSLRSVTISGKDTYSEDSAWEGCSVETIIIADGSTGIESGFSRWNLYGESLTTIIIPSSVTYIYYSAFLGCKNLTDVYYKGTEEQWNAIEVQDLNENLTNATIHYNYAS